ncbi:MAG: aldehyde ferredoxin oxidoreductase family protein [Dehalococcoidia bacterium]|nr:aldehyde ferredoxin oxidoreductase family protein [Dehalococcoidia bacterium]
MYGWAGTILDVDLSCGKIRKEPFDQSLGKDYLGGRGINSRILFSEVRPGIDAASPDNLLIFGTGPLGGTVAPSANRMSVTAKSFAYPGIGMSNVGGSFGPELKWAGYDHVVIRGRAEEPVYIFIDDDTVTIRPAKHLWNRNTWETDRLIKNELGDPNIKVASIGPAGEKLVRFAVILFTMHRVAGMTGMGAVMGSKNLKAIAVRGTGSIRVADPKRMIALTREITNRIMQNPYYRYFSVHGSPASMLVADKAGILSIRNFQQASPWEGAVNFKKSSISQYYTRDKACHACPLHCSHFFEVKDGPYKGEKGEGVEGGLVYPFGPNLGNSSLESMFRILNLCNQYGMDTIELPFAIAAAMEWYQQGIITQKDTDGIELEWGNVDAIIAMIHKVGNREGFGDLLAEGGYRASLKIGGKAAEDYSHCKGMGMGSDDPRLMKAYVLSGSTSTIPGHHEEGYPPAISPEKMKTLIGTDREADPTSYEKAATTVYYQNLCTMTDAVEICKFISGWAEQEIHFQEAADLFSAATGIERDAEQMKLAAERINALERAFAVREGISREDDRFRGRIAREPIQGGPCKGEEIDPEKFESMLDRYYELRDWDVKTGIPSRAKLEMLGLDDVAKALSDMGKLPPQKNTPEYQEK